MIDGSTLLAYFGFILWMFALFVHLVANVWGKYYLYSWRRNKHEEKNGPTSKIGVSIVKTMTPSSPYSNALSNLEALFMLNYPEYEILICIPDKDNELVQQIQSIMTKYSNVDAKLFSDACQQGVNPKINNMLQCYGQIKYDYLWVCDSNIFVNENSLTEMIFHFNDPDVGMVHQLPYVKSGRYGFANCLEKIYFGTQHARWYLFFNFLGICCTNGMSSLMNKTYLDEAGGLEAFSCYIAEDHFIGQSFYDRGFKIVFSTEPALQNPDVLSVTHFVNRITRWQKLRLTMIPASVLEPLIECFAIGVIGAFSASKLFDISILKIFCFHISFWFIMDQILLWIIEGSCSSLPNLGQSAMAWLYRELVTYWIFAKAVWSRKIHWRLGTFDIKYGGKATFMQAPEKVA